MAPDGDDGAGRIAGDIEFLDQMSARVLESLKANTLMIERMAHLKELHKLNEKLCGLLNDILQQRLSACSAPHSLLLDR